MATAPIDCTGWRSNTGLNVVPPLIDFHTPPLAAPTNTVTRPFFSIASTAAIRPLMVAEPMLRMGKPEMVAESNLIACWAEPLAHSSNATAGSSRLLNQREQTVGVAVIEGPLGFGEIVSMVPATASWLPLSLARPEPQTSNCLATR